MSALPSQQSAAALVAGQPGAALQVALDAGGRAALIAVGLLVLKVPDKYVVRGAIGGTLAIEAFVLAHEWLQRSAK
jgi:hypothetical protein